MILSVLFMAYKVRTSNIYSSYRPNWISNSKPEQNCASLIFSNKDYIIPGESNICELQPLKPAFWSNVKLNDVLQCMEGSRATGEAIVLQILPNEIKE